MNPARNAPVLVDRVRNSSDTGEFAVIRKSAWTEVMQHRSKTEINPKPA